MEASQLVCRPSWVTLVKCLAAYAACTILNGDVKGCFEECNNIVFTKGCMFANIDRGVRYRIIFEIIGDWNGPFLGIF